MPPTGTATKSRNSRVPSAGFPHRPPQPPEPRPARARRQHDGVQRPPEELSRRVDRVRRYVAEEAEDGERIIAKLEDSGEVTFKVYKEDDGRRWLLPLNPKHEPVREAFTVLGTVVGKWEDED